MTSLEQAIHAARAVALALAVHRWRRDRGHLPFVLFLAWIAVADLVRYWINRGPLAGLQGPLVGWPRVFGHVESALFISWHFGMAALARRVFGRQLVWPVGVAYAAVVTALVVSYPAVRAGRLAVAYTAIELLALGISFAALITWAWRRERPNVTHTCTIVLVFVEMANLAGPYMSALFGSWNQAQLVYLALYTGLILVQLFPLPLRRHP